jgi:hypothetical protein
MTKRKRGAHRSTCPKGSYPLPTGGYISTSAYRSERTGRVLRVRAVHRDVVDPKAVAQALIAIAIEQAQAQQNKHVG